MTKNNNNDYINKVNGNNNDNKYDNDNDIW